MPFLGIRLLLFFSSTGSWIYQQESLNNCWLVFYRTCYCIPKNLLNTLKSFFHVGVFYCTKCSKYSFINTYIIFPVILFFQFVSLKFHVQYALICFILNNGTLIIRYLSLKSKMFSYFLILIVFRLFRLNANCSKIVCPVQYKNQTVASHQHSDSKNVEEIVVFGFQ